MPEFRELGGVRRVLGAYHVRDRVAGSEVERQIDEEADDQGHRDDDQEASHDVSQHVRFSGPGLAGAPRICRDAPVQQISYLSYWLIQIMRV